MTAYAKAKVPDPNVAAIKEKTDPAVPPALKVFYPYRTGVIITPANPDLPLELVGESAALSTVLTLLLLCA